MWTFGRKIAAGFALAFLLLLTIGVAAYRSIDSLTRTSLLVTHSQAVVESLGGLLSLMKDIETGARGFVITGDDAFLEPYQRATTRIPDQIAEIRNLIADNPNHRKRLDAAEPLVAAKLALMKRNVDMRKSAGLEQAAKLVKGGDGKQVMDDLRGVLAQMDREERDLLKLRAEEVASAANGGKSTILIGTLLCLLLTSAAGVVITNSLSSRIGSAVQHVQSSTTELQAAANQQLTGAKEQATAMNEIATTIRELLATSRQIAESAQRVAAIAGETATAAQSGDATVASTTASVAAIRQQVDTIVNHMLGLGKKSQQIGSILEIINELAEQTNILAINATIEAAGAGEAGKRFAVVADEIRKLADRVGGSTKEIRELVDDVRAAVNTTVMATEGGSKAVDAGTRQFADVAASFRRIVGLVTTTTEAANEIELSTKQQATAVEQVNVAIANVSQAARETEASSSQTLQTASQLTSLSADLAKVIRPGSPA